MLAKMGFCWWRAVSKAVAVPGKPVDGIVRMLEQVRRFFARQMIGVPGLSNKRGVGGGSQSESGRVRSIAARATVLVVWTNASGHANSSPKLHSGKANLRLPDPWAHLII